MTERVFCAVDIGASGGRVMAGIVESGRMTLSEVHRFPNQTVTRAGHLHWNVTELYEQVLEGLAKLAAQYPTVESVGIDTWGVDYGMLDRQGSLLDEPMAYRDERTAQVIDQVHQVVTPEELYRITGVQFLPFNTIYQLEAERTSPSWDQVAHVVLLPDLLAYWLTGTLRTEATNASTTGLTDAVTGAWSMDLLSRLQIAPDVLPEMERPGQVRGLVRPELCDRLGLGRSTVVTTVGSHDTASAVVGIPARDRSFAFVSCGTWSLVGMEVDAPVVSDDSRKANFSNERGVDGRVRLLRNVGGLWLLQESLRSWEESGRPGDLPTLIHDAERLPTGGARIDVDAVEFIAPGGMPERIDAAVMAQGHPALASGAHLVRCVLDSLATAYADTIARVVELAGREVSVVHMVGGGSQNALLCQLTATASGLPVVAGPVEATAFGNVMVQARAHGALGGTLEDIRHDLSQCVVTRWFAPGHPLESI
jgi:rhamnulokinase